MAENEFEGSYTDEEGLPSSSDEDSVHSDEASQSSHSETTSSFSSLASSSVSVNRLLSVDDLRKQESQMIILESIQQHVHETSGLQWVFKENKRRDQDEALSRIRYIRLPSEDLNQVLENETLARMFQENPSYVPIFDLFSVFIPIQAMTGSAKYLADFNTNVSHGHNMASTVVALCKAFSDNSQGFTNSVKMGDMYVRDAPSICRLFDKLYPKGKVLFEMLVHDAPDPYNERAFLSNIEEVFEHDNVAGVRLWFLVTDPWFDINKALRKIIKENSDNLGETQRLQELHIEDDLAAQQRAMLFDDNPLAYDKAEKRVNAQVRAYNKKLDENAKATQNTSYTSTVDIYKTIVNAALYQNFVVSEYLGIPKIVPGSDQWDSLNTLGNDHSVDEQVIRVHETFGTGNVNVVEKVQRAGVSSTQDTDSNYLREYDDVSYDLPDMTLEEFVVPHPELCFLGNRGQFAPSNIENIRLPWSFDMAQVVIDCLLDMSNKKNDELYVEADLERARRIRSIPQRLQFLRNLNGHREDQIAQEPSLLRPDHITGSRFEPVILANKHFSCYGNMAKRFGDFDSRYGASSDVASIETPLEKARDQYLEQIRAYNDFEANIDPNMRRFILMNLIRHSGRNRTREVLEENKDNTMVFNAAARRLRTYMSDKLPVFHEVPIIDQIGVTGSIFASDLVTLSKVFGINNTAVMHDILQAAYRASSDNVFEEVMGLPGMIIHFATVGAPGTGKSYETKLILITLLLAGTMEAAGTFSARAYNTPKASWGNVAFTDELPEYMNPFDKSIEQKRSMMKQILSDGTTSRKVLTMPDTATSGREKVMERRSYNIVTKVRQVQIINSNLWYQCGANGDTSLTDRFLVNTILSSASSTRSGDGLDMIRAQLPTSFQNTRANMAVRNQRVQMFLDRHALMVWLNTAVITGNIPLPNVDMFVVLWNHVIEDLANVCPSVLDKSRRLGAQPMSMAINRAMYDAVCIVTNSMASPLLHYNEETGAMDVQPFSIDMAPIFAPYMFLSQRSAIWIITRLVNAYVMNEQIHQTAEILASHFCNYFTPEKRALYARSENAPSNFGEEVLYDISDDGETINMGMLRFQATEEQVISILCHQNGMGHTPNTAKNALQELESTKITCPKVVYNLGDPDQSHANQGQRETVRVLKRCEEAGSFNNVKTYTWHISIFYLAMLSPERVLQRVMKAITVKGIRPGRMLLGKTANNNKAYWSCYDITEQMASQATTEISLSKRGTMSSAEKRFFMPEANQSHTRHRRNQTRQLAQASSDVLVDLAQADDEALRFIESQLHIHWLMKEFFMNLSEAKNFTHAMTDHLSRYTQKSLVEENDPILHMKYPENFIQHERRMAREAADRAASSEIVKSVESEFQEGLVEQLSAVRARKNLDGQTTNPITNDQIDDQQLEQAMLEAEHILSFASSAQARSNKRTHSSTTTSSSLASMAKRQRQQSPFPSSSSSSSFSSAH